MSSKTVPVIAALFFAELSSMFEGAMVFAALPSLIREFGDPAMVGWLVTSHALIAAGAALLAGRLGDIYGRKRIILLMLAIAMVGSFISAVSTSFALLLFGRALQGLVAAVLPLTIGVLRDSLPEDRVPVGVGIIISSTTIGVSAGLVLGGVIIDQLDWHWMFAASGILLAVSLVVVRQWVPAHSGIRPAQPIDWIEGLLPVPGITALLIGITMAKSWGWLDPKILALVALGAAILALWARRSLAASEPFLDLRLLATRDIAIVAIVTVLLGLGAKQIVLVFSTLMQAPSWTMAGLGLSATVAGLAKMPSNIVSIGAGPFSGWFSQRYGNRAAVAGACGLVTAGWIVALLLPQSLVQIIVLICVIAFGTTMLSAAIPNVIVSAVPNNRTSEAVGMTLVIRGMATAVGAQLIAVVLSLDTVVSPDGKGSFPSADAFRFVIIWIVGLSLAATLLALLLARRAEQAWPHTIQAHSGPHR